MGLQKNQKLCLLFSFHDFQRFLFSPLPPTFVVKRERNYLLLLLKGRVLPRMEAKKDRPIFCIPSKLGFFPTLVYAGILGIFDDCARYWDACDGFCGPV